MKKGFTLVELLGVIVILAIISMIAVPIIDRSINKSDEDLYNTQINQIVKAAKSYYAEPDNIDKLPQKDRDKVTVYLEDLKKGGYLPTEVNNPKTGEPFNANETFVTVTKVGNHFEYSVTTEDDVVNVGEGDA